jgi:hypothetical protein
MAKLWHQDGEIVRLLLNELEEAQFGPPNEFDGVFEFDPDTNQDVLQGINQDWNAHKVVGGMLTKNGNPILFNSPGEKWIAREYDIDVRARFLASQLAEKSPQEIYDILQNKINGWSSLAEAKGDLAEILPLLAAIIAWKVV